MDVFWIAENGTPRPEDFAQLKAAKGFLWFDCSVEEMVADPEAWRADIERRTGIHIYDLHLQDASNPVHPSYFDNTATYEMVVFRRIITSGAIAGLQEESQSEEGIPLLAHLHTEPIAFFVAQQALISVRHGNSLTCDDMKRRLSGLFNQAPRPDDAGSKLAFGAGLVGRPPAGPAELMLRLLNGMVDKYLSLRHPLTQQLDQWQRELLNPNGRFRNWLSLLDARIVLRTLENLCEEQYDALSELRDAALDRSEDAWGSGAFDVRRDALVVRVNDVMEHVNRVLGHARRMESSVENAVQLHFSATAHRTNEVMRILTIVTVIFMPLTLITGIFGMNLDDLPLVHDRGTFWLLIIGMVVLAMLLWTWFTARRFLEMRPYRLAEALARKAASLRSSKHAGDY